ncbi:hypothetical protein SVAN01_01648 [Stagonosporopsis vannaccii]|nr:hypothetical protein SVAN01_01648 [Stagonosporopsis vannaccii]
MRRKARGCRGWNVSERSSPYGSWTRRRHRDFAMTDATPEQRPRAGARPVQWGHSCRTETPFNGALSESPELRFAQSAPLSAKSGHQQPIAAAFAICNHGLTAEFKSTAWPLWLSNCHCTEQQTTSLREFRHLTLPQTLSVPFALARSFQLRPSHETPLDASHARRGTLHSPKLCGNPAKSPTSSQAVSSKLFAACLNNLHALKEATNSSSSSRP